MSQFIAESMVIHSNPSVDIVMTSHNIFCDTVMFCKQQWIESSEEPREQLEQLPLPLVLERDTSVVCVGPAPLAAPRRRAASSLALGGELAAPQPAPAAWRALEEMLLQVAQGAVPMIFKPTVDLYTDITDSEPLVPQGGLCAHMLHSLYDHTRAIVFYLPPKCKN